MPSPSLQSFTQLVLFRLDGIELRDVRLGDCCGERRAGVKHPTGIGVVALIALVGLSGVLPSCIRNPRGNAGGSLQSGVLGSGQLPSTFEFAKENPNVLPYVAVSAGSGKADLEKLYTICKAHPDIPFVCLDVANGYQEAFVSCVREVRENLPSHVIVAGNVVTGEMVEELLISGADIVKVGIGPGSVCTTRKQTGVGYPQLSAVLECADAAHGLGGHIVSDGGCTCPGDFSKAFGAGADFVMCGGILAGHDESGGEVIESPDGKMYKKFYGMSSSTAMNKHSGGVANYRASEGKTVTVPYRGKVEKTLLEYMGGVRSTCTYVGAASLKELSKRTTFIRVSKQINEIFGKAPNEQEVNNQFKKRKSN